MKKLLVIAIIIFCAYMAYTKLNLADRFGKQKNYPHLENSTLETLTRSKVSLADYSGRVILLDFWGSWCKPCQESNPAVKRIYAKFKDKNFILISIAVDTNREDVYRYMQGISYEHIVAYMSRDLRDRMGNMSIPTFILVDQKGNMIRQYEGWKPSFEETIAQDINDLLQGT